VVQKKNDYVISVLCSPLQEFLQPAPALSQNFQKTVSCLRRLHRPDRKDTGCDARLNVCVNLVKYTEVTPTTLHMPLACLRITVQCHLYLHVQCCSSFANVVYIQCYGILELDVNVNAKMQQHEYSLC